MKDTRSFKEKSFQDNLDNFLDDKVDDLKFYRLVNFLNSTYINTAPDELQTEFIDEFFGLDEWATFLVQAVKSNSNIIYYSNEYVHVAETLKKVKEYLLFRMSHRFIDLISENSKLDLKLNNTKIEVLEEQTKVAVEDLDRTKLKLALHNAVIDSVDVDGIFWKDEGWLNVSHVLVEHKLLKLDI